MLAQLIVDQIQFWNRKDDNPCNYSNKYHTNKYVFKSNTSSAMLCYDLFYESVAKCLLWEKSLEVQQLIVGGQ